MAILEFSPDIVSLEIISKIIGQMKKSIFKINILGCSGTGFFCYIPYNNKKFPVMIASNHMITEKVLKESEYIYIELNNEKKK